MLFDSVINRKMKAQIDKRDHLFSFAKAISWRIVGTIDTIIISYIITGKISLAVSIGSIEVFTKITLFYFHDRIWEFFKLKKKVQHGAID